MSALNYFPAVTDTPAVQTRKITRAGLAKMGTFGTVTATRAVSDAVFAPTDDPSLNYEAFTSISNRTAVTIAGTVTTTDPVTLAATAGVAFSLAAGQTLEGYFTLVTITGSATAGSLILNALLGLSFPVATPLLSDATTVAAGSGASCVLYVTMRVTPIAGDPPPSLVEVSRKDDAGSYSIRNIPTLQPDTSGHLTALSTIFYASGDMTTSTFKVRYKSGLLYGPYSNEVTVAVP